jgi:BCD family chlorophyll transporter-like MFS transporter
LLVCVAAYIAIGLGLSATGTALLAAAAERATRGEFGYVAAALWIMMIAGIIVSSVVTGHLLDPFGPARLVAVSAGVGAAAVLLTLVAAGAARRWSPRA